MLPRRRGARIALAAGWAWAALAGCGEEEQSLLPASSEVPASKVCTVYCNMMWTHCHDVWRPYSSIDACMAACPRFKRGGSVGDVYGDTVQCRLTYVLYARRLPQRQAYCREAWPDGGTLCVDRSP